MSFFGGNTSLGATSTPAKPGGLFSFGANTAAATTTATATPAFGAQPGFGGFGTGTQTAPAATNTLGGFGGFGANPATTTAVPQLGGFGTFGGTTTTATSVPTLGGFGGFGTQTNTTNAPTLGGGFGGFGANTQTAQPSLGGFGNSGIGFGAATTAPASGLFGTTVNTNTGFGTSGFGAQTSTTGAFGGFGTNQTTGFGSFGAGFNKPAPSAAPPRFTGFFDNCFKQTQLQQPTPQISADEAFAHSIFNVSIYGDERDTIIAKWNYLQAMWGTGKSFYSQNAAPVTITPENYLCRFKAMGYSRLPGKDNKMGLVALNFNKSVGEVKVQQQQIVHTLNGIFGNKPHLVINIETIKEHEEKRSQVLIYIEEKSQLKANETKRILATEVANFLNQGHIKTQLGNLGVIEVLALVVPDEDQLKEYLDNPPKGIDPRMWRQAKLDNPDSTKFIPVPMIGFADLKWRIKLQESETETHSLYLKKVENDLTELRQRHAAATAKIMEHKRKLAELSHKILKIIVKQECTRKVGMALTPEEEALRTKLENMQAIVSAPTQFKGRLSELLSQMRMQRNQYALTGASEYTIDKDSEDEMKSFLAMQQKAMEVLADTVKKDTKALRIIMEGMPELMRA